MTLRVRTVPLDDAPSLLDLLEDLPEDDRFAYVGGDVELVGAGTVARVPVGTGADRGARAWADLQQLLEGARVQDEVGGRGTGPLAIGSLTFDPEAEGSLLVVPALVVGRRDGAAWVTTSAVDAAPVRWRPGAGHGVRTAPQPVDRPRFAGSSLRDDAWLTAVDAAVAAIAAGELEKVVLARDHHLWSEVPFDVPGLLRALAARFPACRTFLVDGLLGASPEPLLHLEGTAVRSRVLAGTAPRGATDAEDERLWTQLLASEKDRREHAMAVASVTGPLGALGAEIVAPGAPGRLALDNVQHLATDVVARVTEPVPALALLDRIHPTAAVGGVPSVAALARIRRTEGMERGRYAGPVGWTDATGDGEWALALRCAEVDGARARVFAGAGVVEGSLPELELRETQLKLRAMLRVLSGLAAEREPTAG